MLGWRYHFFLDAAEHEISMFVNRFWWQNTERLWSPAQDDDEKEDLSKFGLSPTMSAASGFFMFVAPEAVNAEQHWTTGLQYLVFFDILAPFWTYTHNLSHTQSKGQGWRHRNWPWKRSTWCCSMEVGIRSSFEATGCEYLRIQSSGSSGTCLWPPPSSGSLLGCKTQCAAIYCRCWCGANQRKTSHIFLRSRSC